MTLDNGRGPLGSSIVLHIADGGQFKTIKPDKLNRVLLYLSEYSL